MSTNPCTSHVLGVQQPPLTSPLAWRGRESLEAWVTEMTRSLKVLLFVKLSEKHYRSRGTHLSRS